MIWQPGALNFGVFELLLSVVEGCVGTEDKRKIVG